MFDYDYGDGINDETFRECVDEYIYTHHYDNDLDDIEKEWDNLSIHEKVKKIIEELKRDK